MFKDEDTEEFRIAHLDGEVPGQHHSEVKHDARDPEGERDSTQVTLYGDKKKDDDGSEGGCDWAFSQGCERQENVKNGEIHARTNFVPCVPAEQCDGESGGQRHVGRSGTCKSNDGGATSRDEGAVEFTAGSKPAEEEVDGCDEHGGVEGGGHAGGPVRNAEGAERQHRLPVVQHRLFQPRLALQRRRNPIGAIEHFARHLRVTWFVGAEQTERPEAIEEKKSGDRREQQQVGASAWIRSL